MAGAGLSHVTDIKKKRPSTEKERKDTSKLNTDM